MTVAQIGVLMSMIQVLRIIGPNVWGYVADHYDRRVPCCVWPALPRWIGFSGFFIGSTFATSCWP
jgi:PPP family 3-phenylpropionic acid transporter